jgi:hypothetical protein
MSKCPSSVNLTGVEANKKKKPINRRNAVKNCGAQNKAMET